MLLTRDSKKWFKSMERHTGGRAMGNTRRHCNKTHHREVVDFFEEHGPHRLFVCSLDEEKKWTKLGSYSGIIVPADFRIHMNRKASFESHKRGAPSE